MEAVRTDRDPGNSGISLSAATAIPGNLLITDIPHYPLLVEHIPYYISHADYSDFIRTIQVVGEIIPQPGRRAMIRTLTNGRTDTFPLSIKDLTIKDIYVEKSPNVYSTVWEMHPAFKVFGSLENIKGEIILEVNKFIPVENVADTIEIISNLSKIAKFKKNLFGHSIKDNVRIRSYWEASKINGKRVLMGRTQKNNSKKTTPSEAKS